MENVQHAFYEASHWNVDNSYGALNATARGTFPRLHEGQILIPGQHCSTSIYHEDFACRYPPSPHQTLQHHTPWAV
jgi:hypothetical protein